MKVSVLVVALVLLGAILLPGIASSAIEGKTRYDGYSLIRVNLGGDSRRMAAIMEDFPDIDVWGQTPETTDLLLRPDVFPLVTSRLGGLYEIVVKDIQQLIDAEIDPNRYGPPGSPFFFSTYGGLM